MKLKYSEHAELRLLQRHITKTMVTETIKNPDRTGVGYLNRNLAYKTFPQGEIKVVYAIQKSRLFIVSVIWEKGGPICK